MNIVLMTYGTRGDVQPFVALAHVLGKKRHRVRLCGPPNFRQFIESCGVEFAPAGIDSTLMVEAPRARELLRQGKVHSFFRVGAQMAAESMPETGRQLAVGVTGAEAIISSGFLGDWAWALGEKLRVPVLLGYTFPLIANGDYANPFVTTSPIPTRLARRLTHTLFEVMNWRYLKPMVDSFRTSLGLGSAHAPAVTQARSVRSPILHMWSATVAPRPREWTDRDILTGYWRLPSELRSAAGEGVPPEGLMEWLGRGRPPVFITFGGMPIDDPDRALRLITTASQMLGVRFICSFPSARKPRDPGNESVFVASAAIDHDWLLPQCLAVVHHGGAGSTAASLTAGVPTVVCSVFGDQPFWGEQVTRLGVGAHLPFSKLNDRTLATALQAATQSAVSARARNLAAILLGEDGLGIAVKVIEAHLGRGAFREPSSPRELDRAESL